MPPPGMFQRCRQATAPLVWLSALLLFLLSTHPPVRVFLRASAIQCDGYVRLPLNNNSTDDRRKQIVSSTSSTAGKNLSVSLSPMGIMAIDDATRTQYVFSGCDLYILTPIVAPDDSLSVLAVSKPTTVCLTPYTTEFFSSKTYMYPAFSAQVTHAMYISAIASVFIADFGVIRIYDPESQQTDLAAGRPRANASVVFSPVDGDPRVSTFSTNLRFGTNTGPMSSIWILDIGWNCIRRMSIVSGETTTTKGTCQVTPVSPSPFSLTVRKSYPIAAVQFTYPLLASTTLPTGIVYVIDSLGLWWFNATNGMLLDKTWRTLNRVDSNNIDNNSSSSNSGGSTNDASYSYVATDFLRSRMVRVYYQTAQGFLLIATNDPCKAIVLREDDPDAASFALDGNTTAAARSTTVQWLAGGTGCRMPDPPLLPWRPATNIVVFSNGYTMQLQCGGLMRLSNASSSISSLTVAPTAAATPPLAGWSTQIVWAFVVGGFGIVIVIMVLVAAYCWRKSAKRERQRQQQQHLQQQQQQNQELEPRPEVVPGGSLEGSGIIRVASGEKFDPHQQHRHGMLGDTPSSASSDIVERRATIQEVIRNGAYQRGRVLGRGASGTVYAVSLADGQCIAMKSIPLSGDDSKCMEQERRALEEVRMLIDLHHPNVIEIYGIRIDKENHFAEVFMELISGGSLGGFIRSMPVALKESTARAYVQQIVSGVAFLHAHGIVHRDIKAENILLWDCAGVVKIADFGAAKTLTSSTTNTIIGTPYFMAPEVIMGVEGPAETTTSTAAGNNDNGVDATIAPVISGYGKPADIWSIGILTAELLNKGRPPWPCFNNASSLFMHIADPKNAPVLPKWLTAEAVAFIRACTMRDPALRPTAADLMEHPWLHHQGSSLADSDDIHAAAAVMLNEDV